MTDTLRRRTACVLLVTFAAGLFALPFGCDASAPPARVQRLPPPDTLPRPAPPPAQPQRP